MSDVTAGAIAAAMRTAWDADYAWWKSPDRERGGSWGSVPAKVYADDQHPAGAVITIRQLTARGHLLDPDLEEITS